MAPLYCAVLYAIRVGTATVRESTALGTAG
ncbi:hypothetical protein IWX63_002196 [Arthrobacter sp. CAN_A2]